MCWGRGGEGWCVLTRKGKLGAEGDGCVWVRGGKVTVLGNGVSGECIGERKSSWVCWRNQTHKHT